MTSYLVRPYHFHVWRFSALECPNGHPVAADWRFCIRCGVKL